MASKRDRRLLSRVRTFASLSPADHWALATTAIRLLGSRGALAVLPYATVRRFFARPHRRSFCVSDAPAYRRRVSWAVRAAGRWVLGDRPCLAQALVAERLLRRGGLEAHLRIGVAKGPDGELLAHAWVESGDVIVVGRRTSPARYRQFEPISEDAPKAQSAYARSQDVPPVPSLR